MLISFREMAVTPRPISIRETLDISDIVRSRTDLLSAAPLEVDVTATYEGAAIVVQGQLRTTVQAACSRCLKPAAVKLDIPFDETFVQAGDEGAPPEEDDLQRISGESFDLRPYVEEYVHTELPYAPLCKDDCQGICPTCGGNRNEASCSCDTERIDPRLEGLKDFFNKQ